MHLVCRCSLPVWRRSFLKKGTPRALFWPRPGSAPGGIWSKNNNTSKGPSVLHSYQVSSKSIKRFWRRSWICENLQTTTTTTTTDGRTDDGRCAMTIAHLSLRLRWAKNGSAIFVFLFLALSQIVKPNNWISLLSYINLFVIWWFDTVQVPKTREWSISM